MHKRLVGLGVGLLCLSSAFAAEPDVATAPAVEAAVHDEWAGKWVMAKSASVVLRERPDDQAPAVLFSPMGVWLTAEHAADEWLKLEEGWARLAEVVPKDQVVGYFTSQLAQGESAFLYLGRARGWLEQNDIDKAQFDVGEALRLDPQNARAYFARAKIAAAQQRSDDELANYDRAVQLDPRDPVPVTQRGLARSRRGDYDGAIADLDKAIELFPADFRLWAARGWCRASKGDYDQAMADFNAALQRNPRCAFAHSRRAYMYARRGEHDKALADAEEAVRLDPKMAHGFAVRGAAHAAQGRLDAALADLDESIRLDPTDAYVQKERGRLHQLKGDLDSAVLDYTQAISLKGDDASVYFRRAEVWSKKGDQANVIIDLTECLRLQPNRVDAYVARGYSRLESDLDAAMQDFEAALKLDPRQVGALIGQAEVWTRQGDHENAIEALTAALEVAPEIADIYERRGRVRMEQGERDLAIDDFTAALRINPKHTGCLFLRSSAWSQKGNLQRALDDCRAILAIEPKNLMAYYEMANAHSWAGQKDDALEDFAAALRIDPGDAQIRFLRAYELFNQGKLDRALADIDEVIRSGKHVAEAYCWRGYFWMLRKNWHKAIAGYSEAIRLKRDDAHALARRATCWLGVKEFDKAIQDADEALRLDLKSEEAATVRRQAMEAKSDPSKAVDPLAEMAENNNDDSSPEEFVPAYHIELRAPAGVKLMCEDGTGDEFKPGPVPFPFRLPMRDEVLMRLKLVGIQGDASKVAYVRLESKRLSPHDVAILGNAAPTITLSQADLDATLSGKDVTIILLLRNGNGEAATEPEFELLSSREFDSAADLLREAPRHGALVATLDITAILPPLMPFLPDARFLPFCLRGPKGLRLAHESPVAGQFDDQSASVPAHFALLPSIQMHFKMTGSPLGRGEPLFALLTLPEAWPAAVRGPNKIEVSVVLTKAVLEAAAAGQAVTCVVYLADPAQKGESPRIETLHSTQMAPPGDAVAEANRRGKILVVVKLGKEIGALHR